MSPTELGGFKEIILGIEGEGAFRKLQFESGGHRVQRVPETEAKGRIHTSAATVAVMAEPEDVEIDLKPDDYRKDIFHASGPGGQHVNKTASAIRLTHYETGIVVSCQDEKSQHKNLAKALRVLKTRLYEAKREAEHKKRSDERKTKIGSGDRSQRIRTYNFPENRAHRPPHQSDALQARQHHRRQPQPRDRRPDGIRAAGAAGRVRNDRLIGGGGADCIVRFDSSIPSLIPNPSMSAEPWTVGRLLQWTTDYLKGHGSESPRLDAEVLLAQALGCQRIELYTTLRRNARRGSPGGVPRAGPPPGRRDAGGLPGRPPRVLLALVPRHARRADPPAGNGTAGGGRARSGQDVGSPRPLGRGAGVRAAETRAQRLTIADVGTGSGIIAVCLAKHLPACRVTAIDISPAALAVAKDNAKQHGVAERIEFVESDLFAARAGRSAIRLHREQSALRHDGRDGRAGRRRAEVRAAGGAAGRPARHGSDRVAGRPGGRASCCPADTC